MSRLYLAFLTLFFCISTRAAVSGSQIYARACSACHQAHIAKLIQAPAFGDDKAWSTILAHAKEQAQLTPNKFPTPQSYLLRQVEEGKGIMPAGGNCKDPKHPKKFCSQADYLAAINYMIGQNKVMKTQSKDMP